MTFYEFLNRKNKEKLNPIQTPKLDREPKDFMPAKPSMTPFRRSIMPHNPGLVGQPFRNRTVATKPTDFLPRSQKK